MGIIGKKIPGNFFIDKTLSRHYNHIMTQTTNLQIPIKTSLRNKALLGAKSLGFTNLQDSIRIFLQQLASNRIEVSFQTKAVALSDKNDRRYTKMIDDIDSGKEKPLQFDTTKDMFKYLNDSNRTSP